MMVVLIVIGVCGSGKTTIGKALATKLMCPFEDADEHHSTESIKKMERGTPLTDQDRLPWLMSLHGILTGWVVTNTVGVLACSALKKSYRDTLTGRFTSNDISQHCYFVALLGSYELLAQRMHIRSDHFMPESLLQSQLDIMEVPLSSEVNCLSFDIDNTVEYIREQVIAILKEELQLSYNN